MTTNEEPEPASPGQEHFYWGKYIATEFINWTINLMGSLHNKLCIKWASCPKRQYCTLSQLGQRFDLLPLFSAMEASLCSRRAQPCFTNKSSTLLSSPCINWYSCRCVSFNISLNSNNLKTSRARTYLHQHSCWPSQLHDWTFYLRSQIGCPDETSEELCGFQRPGSTKGLHRGQLAMDSLIVKTTKLWMQTPEIFIIEIWQKQRCKVFRNSSFLKLQDLDCYTVTTIQNLKF